MGQIEGQRSRGSLGNRRAEDPGRSERRRSERLWQAWTAHPGTRTLVFCCSIEHARFTCDWLRARGVRIDAVFAGPGSADRERALPDVAAGALDAVCAVDIFNEGVDLPAVDRVVMLRPTGSPVVFLQQVGRGLRRSDGKAGVVVIDFVGNHAMFLDRVRRPLSLAPTPTPLRALLQGEDAPRLPPGCSIDVELEAIDVLRRLLPRGGAEVERVHRDLRLSRGHRPTAGALYRMRVSLEPLRNTHGGWFDFVAAEGDLPPDEAAAFTEARAWLHDLESTAMTSPSRWSCWRCCWRPTP